jgi:hypothetical protein
MRRGAALLLALGALVAVTTLGAAALRAATTARLVGVADRDTAEAAQLVRDLEPALLAWLGSGAISGHSDWAPVFASVRGSVGVTVHAVDLSGRLRIDRLESFAAMGLPQTLRMAELDELLERPAATPALVEEVAIAARCDAFPISHAGAPAFDAATWLTAYGDGALNVRTAPLPLLEAALRGADPSAARLLLVARQTGEPIPPAVMASIQRRTAAGDADRLVALSTGSTAAAFLVTIEHGRVARRWWLVAELGDPRAIDDARRRARPQWRWMERRRIAS